MKRPIVDVAIVTYNRLAKLQRALDCYDKQTVTFQSFWSNGRKNHLPMKSM